MAYTQSSRFLTAKTALGEDALFLASFAGEEELSRPFHYTLEFLSEKPSVDVKAIVGKPVSWGVTPVGGTERRYHGIVKNFVSAEMRLRSLRAFRAEVVPYFWLLTQTTDCRIFQNKTVPEIINEIFSDNGLTDFQPNLKATYPKLEYCVQYRESDFNFVSRLMEEYGIFYFFVHSADKHMMVLADHKGAYKDSAEKNVDYSAGGASARLITAWEHRVSFRTGKWAQTDYYFETPSASLMTNTDALAKAVNADKFEQYDYPGRYIKKPDGTPLTKIRMEEVETVFDVVDGRSTCSTFSPAHKFTLANHPIAAEKGNFVLTSVRHKCLDESHVAGSSGKQEYTNVFTCIPDSVTFRPARTTPRGSVTGPQTAVVVGPKGEEIYTDKYGRIKVQFHWDRVGKKDENSSCWIRVSQSWAGKRWGATFIPRIGQEVIVDFLEGDPDRPIITGRVYNAEQMYPYLGDGPDTNNRNNHKQDPKVMGVKSCTTPGGAGFNEWRFDDTKGKEQIFFHAQKDMDVRIKNDRRELVLHDAHLIVGAEKDGKKVGDQREEVFRDKHLKVHRDQEEHIGGCYRLHVGGVDGGAGEVQVLIDGATWETIVGQFQFHVKEDVFELYDKHYNQTVKDQRSITAENNDTLHVKLDRIVKIDANDNLIVGGDRQEKISGRSATDVTQEIHLKAGQTVIIEAGTQLSLKVGGNFIDINSGGIFIKGSAVMINSGGAAGSGSGSSPSSAPDAQPPDDSDPAEPIKPDVADNAVSGQKSCP